jgi:hypothetical protein
VGESQVVDVVVGVGLVVGISVRSTVVLMIGAWNERPEWLRPKCWLRRGYDREKEEEAV